MKVDETIDPIQRILPLNWQRTRRSPPISISVLQSKKRVYTEDDLRRAGERAGVIPFDGLAGRCTSSRQSA
jgi:hypothetical protein